MNDLNPTIEFRVAGFTPSDNAFKFVLEIIRPAMQLMGLTQADLPKVVVADDDQYGPTINEFSPNDGYTDDGIYQGIGKILPQIEAGIYVRSNLVMHHCVIGSFATSDDDRPAGEGDAMRYAIYHELGHCSDYRSRPEQHTAKPREDVSSVVPRCTASNLATLVSEYAACFISASFMTRAGFTYLADTTAQNLGEYLNKLAKKRDKYLSGSLELYVVRDAAMGTFWRGMIEYAKLFAFLHGNPALAADGKVSLLWPGESHAGELIQSMFTSLCEAWKSYPNCLEAFDKSLTDLWFALSEAEGYRFEVKPDGDCLWLT